MLWARTYCQLQRLSTVCNYFTRPVAPLKLQSRSSSSYLTNMSRNDESKDILPRSSKGQHNTIDLTNDEDMSARLVDLTGSDGEDEDLKRAIALSLLDQQEPASSSPPQVPKLDSQSRDSTQPERQSQSGYNAPSNESSNNSLTSLLGLNRKQMEAERLARLKRKRDVAGEDRTVSPPPLRRDLPPSTTIASRSKPAPLPSRSKPPPTTYASNSSQMSPNRTFLPYPDGKVLLTSMKKSQNQSISLSELLAPTDTNTVLTSALLSTYIVDFDWLLPHFDTRNVSFVLALHARDDQEKRSLQQDFAGIPNVRLLFPHVGGIINCMHSKLMLLFYENAAKDRTQSRCRVAIPSANLVPWDWGVGELMENILFVIDLPLRDQTKPDGKMHDTKFGESLVLMLQAMGTPDEVVKKLERFDFSKTAQYNFIHTIGGSHVLSTDLKSSSIKNFMLSQANEVSKASPASVPSSRTRTGIIGLSDAIRDLGLSISEKDQSYPPKLDFITSSLGNLKENFLQNLFLAACGHAPEIPTKVNKVSKSSKTQLGGDTVQPKLPHKSTLMRNMTVYFPSDQTVQDSKGGPNAAGTICFQSKWWDSANDEFPRELLVDCVGVRRDGILMHSKVLFGRFAKPKEVVLADTPIHRQRRGSASDQGSMPSSTISLSDTKSFAGWAYIGSANLSESAWGSLVTDGKTKQPKLNCRNWESGVLIPVPAKPEHEGLNLHDLTLEEVFGDILPVPIRYPGVNMLESGRRPWFFHT